MPIDREKLRNDCGLDDRERDIYERMNGKNSGRKSRPSLNGLQQVFEELQGFNHLALPSIPFNFKQKLPDLCGVYILYSNTDVLYVGQSVDIQNRWKKHDVEGKLIVNGQIPVTLNLRIGWMEVPSPLLDFVEIYLIGLLRPVINIVHNS